MVKRSIVKLKSEFYKLPNMTAWEDIKPKEVYHVPPLLSLERRDVLIITKEGNKATYTKIGDTDHKERTMYDTSIFAKFLVKRKKF